MSLFEDEPVAESAYRTLEMRKDAIPDVLHPYQEAFQALEEAFLKTQFPGREESCENASGKVVQAQKEVARRAAEEHPEAVV